METPVETPKRRSFRCQTPVTTPNASSHPFYLNQVLLHDWWLIKADSDSHGKRLGIGGFTSKGGIETIRCFSSTPIVKRLDAVTVKTDDGMTVMLLGYVNKSRTLENGFSREICDHFLIGFPYDWEEYANLYVSEEPAELSVDACKAPAPESDTLSEDEANKETSLPMGSQKDGKVKGGNVECSGPLTRSRSRLLHSY